MPVTKVQFYHGDKEPPGSSRKESHRATSLQDPQVTYAELQGPQGQPRELGDIYGNSRHPGEQWPQQQMTASAHVWGHQDGREAQTLSLAGAQTTQLLVEPSWRPAVLWDRVTLICQGSGTAGATTWYKDRQRCWQEGQDRLSVTESGTYTCDRPGTGRSPSLTVLDDPLALQVSAQALLEGDTLTLRCWCRQDNHLTRVQFYWEEKDLRGSLRGTKLSLSPLQRHHSGRYRCEGLVGSWQSRSAPVTVTVHELFSVPVLKGPHELTEGSPLNLSCLSTPNTLRPRAPLLHVFYQDRQVVGGPQRSPQLLVPTVRVSHSGNYGCEVHSQGGSVQKSSNRLLVMVCRVPPSGVSLSAQPPGGQVALGDSLVLSCAVAIGTGPLSFSLHREGSGALLGIGPCLELCHAGDNDSGQYRCRVSDGDSVAESDLLNVTVLVPVANATITPGPLSHQVRAGDNMTLRCLVQVGSAPVTFTWLHNGQEVAWGPLLELRDIDVGHSGTYQCVATNQLGQDGHRVFRALSPELALEVTPGSPWVTVASGVGGALFFLLLLVGVIVTCHWWHHVVARKNQERAPPDSPAPPEEGEGLYTHIVVTKKAGVFFYREGKELGRLRYGTELSLPTLQLNHSGSYSCKGRVKFGTSEKSWRSVPVRVTVHGTGPLSFWHREGSGALLGTTLRLELHHVGDNDSGQYQCQGSPEHPYPLQVGEGQDMRGQEDPQGTHADLPGPHGRLQDTSDIHGNVL
ncbi:Fc receptor-like protein 2 [Melozone crissalis]|uniref:Fc receptor-like protein 2 n=1 Tax=Melozone crissalis TaxID=40204 RepID=UPI0023DB7ABC|nr:Fc receptor-like protein 2 [Melozone crissalis]